VETVDPEQAAVVVVVVVVVELANRVLAGESLHGLARHLNDRGVPAPAPRRSTAGTRRRASRWSTPSPCCGQDGDEQQRRGHGVGVYRTAASACLPRVDAMGGSVAALGAQRHLDLVGTAGD
jgi:hypothetical protein